MPTNDELDIVSLEMGLRLKEAGWEHKPIHEGDWYSAPWQEEIWMVGGGETDWYDAYPEIVHLPRRRDLELALVEMGLWTRTDSGPYEMPGGKLVTLHTCCLRNVEGGVMVWHIDGDTPADAVALAWIEAKGELHEPDR